MGTIATRPTYNAGDYDDATLTINSPGTYSGLALRQTTNNAGIITITTAGPVIIENNLFAAKGTVAVSSVVDADITFRNNECWGLSGRSLGSGANSGKKLLEISNAKRLIIQNNYAEHWWGNDIRDFRGDGTPDGEDLKIRYNDFHNNENQAGNPCHWIIMNFAGGTGGGFTAPGTDIGWNRISSVYQETEGEDPINMFGAAGESGNPILIHDNLFQNAGFMWDAVNGGFHSGAAIQNESSHWVDIYNNIVAGGSSAGIVIVGGAPGNINIFSNRVVQTGWLPGTSTFMLQGRQNSWGCGAYGFDPDGAGNPCDLGLNLAIYDNYVRSQRISSENQGTQTRDMSNFTTWGLGWVACLDQGGNDAGSITSLTAAQALALEDAEVATWESRVANNLASDVVIGIESLAPGGGGFHPGWAGQANAAGGLIAGGGLGGAPSGVPR